MKQKINAHTKEGRFFRNYFSIDHPSILCMYEEPDGIYFSNARYNGLFFLDKKTFNVSYIRDFPGEKIAAVNLHRRIIRIDENYYFLPFLGTGLSVWNRSDNSMQFYSIRNFIGDGWGGSSESFLIDGKIWIFPISLGQPLICFNVENKEFEEHGWWNKAVLDFGKIKEGKLSIRSAINIDGEIYFVIIGEKYIFKMNVAEQKIEIYELRQDDDPQTISCIDHCLWFTSWKSNDIFAWDMNTHAERKYNDKIDRTNTDHKYLTKIVKYKSRILGIPRFGKRPFHFDDNQDWVEFEYSPNAAKRIHGFESRGENPLFFNTFEGDDGKLYILPYSMNGCYTYDGKQWDFFELKMDMARVPKDDIYKGWIKNIKLENTYYENINFDLEDFIDMAILV